LNNDLLTSIATLPTGYIEYLNVLKSEGIIRTSYKNKRGVYLWTNKINGHQYIGSSINLSSRLSDYFTNSYLKYQSNRGSVISLAILKYGLSEFTLQIVVLGQSPNRDSISTISDFILLEQYYLDRYSLIYNLRRIAIGAAPISNKNYNKGNTNPQFDKKGHITEPCKKKIKLYKK
jgi:group I intron endonuclease